MADQLAPQFLPCYGHVLVTPAIDRLAAGGVKSKYLEYDEEVVFPAKCYLFERACV